MSVQVSETRSKTIDAVPAGEKQAVETLPSGATLQRGIPERVSATDQLKATRAKAQEDALAFISGCENLDWKKLPPYVTAQILVKIPRKGRGDEIWYMTLEQAFVFAIRCFELGLSPFSDDVFPMKDTWKVGVTTSGKRILARAAGLNLGPPSFEFQERPWATPRDALFGYAKDVGCTATMKVGDSGSVHYCAWLSEWAVPSSPVWKAKPMHMLTVRAYEKALTFASGTGLSAMPDENEIEGEVEIVKPEIVVKG